MQIYFIILNIFEQHFPCSTTVLVVCLWSLRAGVPITLCWERFWSVTGKVNFGKVFKIYFAGAIQASVLVVQCHRKAVYLGIFNVFENKCFSKLLCVTVSAFTWYWFSNFLWQHIFYSKLSHDIEMETKLGTIFMKKFVNLC